MVEAAELTEGLARALRRARLSPPESLERLTGGATMESWRFVSDGAPFILRRAPSPAFMAQRPFGHDSEAAVIEAARGAGVLAPEVIEVLEPGDGIGSGYVMRAMEGTADPREILAMNGAATMLAEAARNLARIHSLAREDLPGDIPEMDYGGAIAELHRQFEEAGGDRPIIALGLRWLEDNCPAPTVPVLNHGDFRLGNLLASAGHITGVLDWELAHLGDFHEDLAFGCMAVWRFSRYDRPALGLGPIADYVSAYEQESGRKVEMARFGYWLVYRTVWWALGCLRNARFWRDNSDRMLERVVISRRTAEQELDLLLLLEDEAPPAERVRPLPAAPCADVLHGEASAGEMAIAVSEWLATIKPRLDGHDRFQLAVARNALGMIARGDESGARAEEALLARALLAGEQNLATPGVLARLRRRALDKLAADVPRYPALAVARRKWTGEK